MIESIVLLASLYCPPTKVINEVPGEPWNVTDNKALQVAKNTCKTKYGQRNKPCLVKFTKKANRQNNYWAICGYERKSKQTTVDFSEE